VILVFEGKTFQTVWPKIREEVMVTEAKELINVVWTVTDPEASEIEVEEVDDFLDPDVHDSIYTYGNRLNSYELFYPEPSEKKKKEIEKIARENISLEEKKEKMHKMIMSGNFFYIGQIKKLIQTLKEDPETRRAIAITWRLPFDMLQEEIPSLIMIEYLIRDDKLLTTAIWRSHEVSKMPADFVALRELSRHVADGIGVSVGPITIHSISAYIHDEGDKE
jgi:thymidylate synthase